MTKPALTPNQTEQIEQLLDARQAELQNIDDALFGDVIGAAHSIGDIKKALTVIETTIDQRSFEQAAALGYSDIASAFIFLQRTLGGLQSAEHAKAIIVQDICVEVGLPYEAVEPLLNAKLSSYDPKVERSEEERLALEANLDKRLASLLAEHRDTDR